MMETNAFNQPRAEGAIQVKIIVQFFFSLSKYVSLSYPSFNLLSSFERNYQNLRVVWKAKSAVLG
jgi:hypothetical protein